MGVQFIADAMLGKLARWLRIMGNDTLYDTSLDDAELIRLARAEDRVLLTRDTDLAKRRGARIILLDSDALLEQLSQLLCLFPAINTNVPRCPACNMPLSAITKQEAWGNVPLYAFAENDSFSHCTGCGKYFWPGTQWRRIHTLLTGISRVDKS
ncbi:MAG: Mut7-C RNAse domain-containing protein [Chloroflexi bacterium]|nr:Mut7-C RNAse domain-containing protein [Chloroflexota bacterium]